MQSRPFLKKKSKNGGRIITIFLHSLESYDGLDVVGMRKHIDGRHIGEPILTLCEEKSKVSHERGRIARNVDDLGSTKRENMRYRTRMESVTWWIEDDGIGLISVF